MKTTPQLWTDMTEEEFQEERKRIRRDQIAHTSEKGNKRISNKQNRQQAGNGERGSGNNRKAYIPLPPIV